jgi:hypothetical protein
MKLTTNQHRVLAELHRNGPCRVNGRGQLLAHDPSPSGRDVELTSASGACSIVILTALGLVCGDGGKLRLTEAGQRHAAQQWPAAKEPA